MKVTMGQAHEEVNESGLGRRLLYNMELKVYYSTTWEGVP